jgi:phage terminase large subunit-like protein
MLQETLNLNFWKQLPASQRERILANLTDQQKAYLRYHWAFWGRPEQLPPSGNWRRWLILAGRGAGKTRTGAEWVREAKNSYGRIALVAETAADARDVLVEGPSGILSISPPWDFPKYEPSKRRLTWPNGAVAIAYNATEPDQLRGPQHEAAWCDELAKWRLAQETWDMLQFGLRIGPGPKCVITTTPRPIPLIRNLLKSPGTVITRGSTWDNRDNLAPEFLAELSAQYEGTRLGRQEIEAELLEDLPGALWTLDLLDQIRLPRDRETWRESMPEMKRVVVAVDPSGSSKDAGAMQGIIVCGQGKNGLFYVLDDYSISESPAIWGHKVVQAYAEYRADLIVAERNFGGDMVKAVIHNANPSVPIRMVTASRGKHVRAEPIAALYERGMVRHFGYFKELEEQMTSMSHEGYQGQASPDRLDACIWGFSELALARQRIGVVHGVRY